MPERMRTLAIVGASARAAAFSALRAGYRVVAADLFADADLARVAPVTRVRQYPDGLADWLAHTECDAWLYTGALENYPDLVDRMAALRPLAGNRGPALRAARDPLHLQTVLSAGGVPFPETRTVAEGLPLDGTWLCKTRSSASGSGVWRLDGRPALERAKREAALFQRCVAGEPAAALFAIRGCRPGDPGQGSENARAALLGVTRQLMSDDPAHPFQYVGSQGPIGLTAPVGVQLATLGSLLATQLGLVGLVGVDLILTPESLHVVEINPRYTASVELVERFTGREVLAGVDGGQGWVGDGAPRLEGSEGRPAGGSEERRVGDPPARSGCFAKTICFATGDVTISAAFHEWALGQSSLDPQRCWLADIPHAGEQIPASRPVLTLFAAAETAPACQEQLAARLAEVKARLYDD
ncbi:MAG TPA: ATP-grasp domain-containing protein [Lacipirellulaceae bacterium]|nr:ATP-grasp domain-containing protein [Lacipirellulaceae bacterium]